MGISEVDKENLFIEWSKSVQESSAQSFLKKRIEELNKVDEVFKHSINAEILSIKDILEANSQKINQVQQSMDTIIALLKRNEEK